MKEESRGSVLISDHRLHPGYFSPQRHGQYTALLGSSKSAPSSSTMLLSPHLSPASLTPAPAREAGQLTPRTEMVEVTIPEIRHTLL